MHDIAQPQSGRPSLFCAGLFFIAVFVWSWSFWLLAAALDVSVKTPLGSALMYAGLLGPMLGGIGFSYFTGSRENWRDYWRRIGDPRRIPVRWFAVILLFTPALLAIAVLLDLASTGPAALQHMEQRAAPFLSVPWTIVPYAAHVLIYGPLPEELGWRGYALDRLQARWNALTSSLVLGALWALFHLPLFFMRDADPHYMQGLWSPWFWQFMIGVIAAALIYTWIFNNTNRSTLAAILFHFVTNFVYLFANTTAGTNMYSTLLLIICAVVVAAFWGSDTLTRAKSGRTPRQGAGI
jgi:membrane protease YdiL (CAAX protease family)